MFVSCWLFVWDDLFVCDVVICGLMLFYVYLILGLICVFI